MRRLILAAIALSLVLGLGAIALPWTGNPAPANGSASLGDSMYPTLGNGGYDALHYSLDLTASVEQNRLDGTATMDARAAQDLDRLSLDLLGFDVQAVAVDGAPATFSHKEGKLEITPPRPLRRGRDFTVAVRYSGTPTTVETPAGDGGWHDNGKGIYVTSEPDGARGWYPVNDHPLDKATYTFRITVPTPYIAVANGLLRDEVSHDGATTYVWEEGSPMASYLASMNVGRFAEIRDTTSSGLPIIIYALPDLETQTREVFTRQAEMIDYFSSILGPYPFDAYGAVLVDEDFRWALEAQTRAVFSRSLVTMNQHVIQQGISHELAHQWFGDSMSLKDWRDIWLNEGFATYMSWLWLEHVQDRDYLEGLMRSQYERVLHAPLYAALLEKESMPPEEVLPILRVLFQPEGHPQSDEEITRAMGLRSPEQVTSTRALGLFGVRPGSPDAQSYIELARSSAPARPPRDNLFTQSVYVRGAMALQALRLRVGDTTFFRILRTYYTQYRGANVGTDDFVTLASKVSDQDLAAFFQTWLYEDAPPPMPDLLPTQ